MAHKHGYTFLLGLLTLAFLPAGGAVGQDGKAGFVPGQPIPAGGPGQYGLIRGGVCGAADVFGKGPYDLFVRLRVLYPFERFDADGVPVYGKSRETTSPHRDGYVIQHGDAIYALVYSGATVSLLRFRRPRMAFEAMSRQAMPAGGGDITGFISDDGRLHAFYTRGDGIPGATSQIHSHKEDYRPYDGSGFWRGGIPIDNLHYARWSSVEMKNLETNERVMPDDDQYKIFYNATGMAIANLGPGNLRRRLFAINRFGVIKAFINGSSTGMSFDGVAYAVDDSPAHVALRHPVILPRPVTIANPDSGLSDLLVSDTGRLWYYPLKGMHNEDYPIYGKRRPVLAAGQPLVLGALPVISPGDIDGDGLVDCIAGNDAGEFLFVKNIGTATAPVFANPVEILAGGKPCRIRAGYNGSIQGPGEASWGYTCPTLFDWDGDGKVDIIANSIIGDLLVMIQEDETEEPPRFSEALPLFTDGLELHLSWRAQPGVTTWGGETVPCIIANDEKNQLRQFFRIDNQNVRRGPVLRLDTGEPIQAHGQRFGGQFGRSKLVAVDWDGDGNIDLLIGTGRAASFPGKGGIPDTLSRDERQASILFLHNTGSNAEPRFAYPVRVAFDGKHISLGVHSCSPAVVDFGGGKDLVVGMEKGVMVYYPRNRLSWE